MENADDAGVFHTFHSSCHQRRSILKILSSMSPVYVLDVSGTFR